MLISHFTRFTIISHKLYYTRRYLNYSQVIICSMSASQFTLFVGDLSIFCTEEDIREIFSPIGELQEIKIIRCEETKKNLSYGFVKYSDTEAAVKAIEELNGTMLCGRPMRIGWASRRSKNEQQSAPQMQYGERSSVHVTYTSYQVDHIVTEEYFVQTFSTFGCVVDAAVKRFEINEETHFQKGYGFVHFAYTPEGIAAAMKCCNLMHNTTIDKVTYNCNISHRLRHSMSGGGQGHGQVGARMPSLYAGNPYPAAPYPMAMSSYPYLPNPATMPMYFPIQVPIGGGMSMVGGSGGEAGYPYSLTPYLPTLPQLQEYETTDGQQSLPAGMAAVPMSMPYSNHYGYPSAYPMSQILAYHNAEQQGSGSTAGWGGWWPQVSLFPHSPSPSPSLGSNSYGSGYDHTGHYAQQQSELTDNEGLEEFSPGMMHNLSAAAIAAAVHGGGYPQGTPPCIAPYRNESPQASFGNLASMYMQSSNNTTPATTSAAPLVAYLPNMVNLGSLPAGGNLVRHASWRGQHDTGEGSVAFNIRNRSKTVSTVTPAAPSTVPSPNTVEAVSPSQLESAGPLPLPRRNSHGSLSETSALDSACYPVKTTDLAQDNASTQPRTRPHTSGAAIGTSAAAFKTALH